MSANLAIREQIDFNLLPQDAVQLLEILDQIENHTADLRKKLMSEIRSSSNAVRLKLDNV
jgi:hypothetical protein